MELISKIYVGLIEFILFLLFVIPLFLVVTTMITGDADTFNFMGQWFGSTFFLVLGLLVYYLIVIFVFGLLSISISNYHSLKRIADLLEAQTTTRKMSEPQLVKPTNAHPNREEPPLNRQ